MSELDLRTLDRDIARSARAERAWWRKLRADAGRAADDTWYEPTRHVTTRTAFQEVASLSASESLRAPLLAWIHRLALTRIARLPILALARARQDAVLRLEEPEPGLHSVGAIVRRALADTDLARSRVWLDALTTAPTPLLAHEKTRLQATREITERLGLADPSTLAPFDRQLLAAEAAELLRRTDDLASSLFARTEDLAGLVAKLVARDVPGVWPTKPDARWLFDQFQGSPLLQGLTVDLGPTPAALGCASFARALARFGAAYARAAVLGGMPFVASSDPSDVHPFRRGALFASLVAEPLFLRKQMGFSRDAAAAIVRAAGATFLAAVRLAAALTTLDVAGTSAASIAETIEDTLKVRVAAELGGVFPRLASLSAERLAATLLARADVVELRGAFDDDWFRNPRGLLFLREMDAAPRPLQVPKELLQGSAGPLAQMLETMAG